MSFFLHSIKPLLFNLSNDNYKLKNLKVNIQKRLAKRLIWVYYSERVNEEGMENEVRKKIKKDDV